MANNNNSESLFSRISSLFPELSSENSRIFSGQIFAILINFCRKLKSKLFKSTTFDPETGIITYKNASGDIITTTDISGLKSEDKYINSADFNNNIITLSYNDDTNPLTSDPKVFNNNLGIIKPLIIVII